MKNKMKYIAVILMVFILTACGEQYTAEELEQQCVEDYLERNIPDLTFEVKDTYETTEGTYLEIINLYQWKQDTENEILYSKLERGLRKDSVTESFVNTNKLEWDHLKDDLRVQLDTYDEMLANNHTDALLQILELSNEEVKAKYDDIQDAILYEGFNLITEIEKERKCEDYQEMFQACSTPFLQEMYYVVYPEEMLEGAMESIYHPVSENKINKTVEFLERIGRYESFASDVEKALKELNNPDDFNGNCSGPDLGLSSEYDYEYDYEDDYADNSDKEENEKPSKKEPPYDPYDVYDYWDPEDFYYDWEDDFEDLEDAEDYWYEAWEEWEG